MILKQIARVAKMLVMIPRPCLYAPEECVGNLHDSTKSNVAAVVNRAYCINKLCSS